MTTEEYAKEIHEKKIKELFKLCEEAYKKYIFVFESNAINHSFGFKYSDQRSEEEDRLAYEYIRIIKKYFRLIH